MGDKAQIWKAGYHKRPGNDRVSGNSEDDEMRLSVSSPLHSASFRRKPESRLLGPILDAGVLRNDGAFDPFMIFLFTLTAILIISALG